jgi:hypothetical protein
LSRRARDPLVAGSAIRLLVSEPSRELDELFAASLAGGQIRSERASLVVVEWRDWGGGGDAPLEATLREHASKYLGRP